MANGAILLNTALYILINLLLYLHIAIDDDSVTSFNKSQFDGGWSGGVMVLGKLPGPRRPTIWITVGQGPTALAVGAGGGCLDILLSSMFSLLFLPLSERRPDID